MAPNRSANGNCSRCTGWIEPPAAESKLTSGRFDRAASSVVIRTGTAATRIPATAPAASGLTLARMRASGFSPASQCASTYPAST